MFVKRYCIEYQDGSVNCYSDDSFWYTEKGAIIKWALLGGIFFLFFAWFVGGYIHAKQRLRKGQPLLGYHRFLVSYPDRQRYGQGGVPQNHFTFYQPQYPNAPYQQRQDAAWHDPPPVYQNNDAPPQYFSPPGATKVSGNQGGPAGMEMPQYGQQYGQQSGVVGGSASQYNGQFNGQQQQSGFAQPEAQSAQLPPRPPTAKTKVMGVLDRFRR